MRFAEAAAEPWIARRVQRWLPRPSSGRRLRLDRRNLYILPTRFGWLWLAAMALQLVLGIQCQSNGPLLLACLMLALWLLALLLTHGNLEGLELEAVPRPEGAGFADEPLAVSLLLHTRVPRHDLNLRLKGQTGGPSLSLPAGDTLQMLPWRSSRRGLQQPGTLQLMSTAPLGLFACWSRWELDAPQLVFPARRPGPVAQLPAGAPKEQQLAAQPVITALEGSDHWLDLRPHRPQDRASRVAWKLLAQGRGRFGKTMAAEPGTPLVLAPQPGLPAEQALEHLSDRISRSAGLDQPLGLLLPGRWIPPGRGRQHLERCLAALALAQLPEV